MFVCSIPMTPHDQDWTCAKFEICKLLFVSSAFSNLFFMWASATCAQLVFARNWEWLWCKTNPGPLCTQFEKYTWEIHLRNALEKYNWEMQLRSTEVQCLDGTPDCMSAIYTHNAAPTPMLGNIIIFNRKRQVGQGLRCVCAWRVIEWCWFGSISRQKIDIFESRAL